MSGESSTEDLLPSLMHEFLSSILCFLWELFATHVFSDEQSCMSCLLTRLLPAPIACLVSWKDPCISLGRDTSSKSPLHAAAHHRSWLGSEADCEMLHACSQDTAWDANADTRASLRTFRCILLGTKLPIRNLAYQHR